MWCRIMIIVRAPEALLIQWVILLGSANDYGVIFHGKRPLLCPKRKGVRENSSTDPFCDQRRSVGGWEGSSSCHVCRLFCSFCGGPFFPSRRLLTGYQCTFACSRLSAYSYIVHVHTRARWWPENMDRWLSAGDVAESDLLLSLKVMAGANGGK